MTPDSTAEARSAGRGIIPPQAAFWCALCVWVLTLAATAAALIYNQVHPLPAGGRDLHWNAAAGVAAAAVTVGFATVGALLAWKRPANPIGWPLCATGLSYAAAGSGLVLLHIPAARAWGHWLGWLFFFGFGFVVFVVLLFPTGSLPSRRWRPVGWAAGTGMVAWVLGNGFTPVSFASGSPSPVGVSGPAGQLFHFLAVGGLALTAAAGLAAIMSLVFRYRRARTVEREQLKWLVYAGGLIVAAVLAGIAVERILGPTAAAVNFQVATGSGAVALVPVAIGVAIFRYHLYDIDLVINKTLVYGSLAVFITAVYVAIVVGVGSLAQRGARPSLALSVAATAVVAIAFQPVRAWVQRLADRLVYGRRATPYQVLADFAGRMTGAHAAEELLARLEEIRASRLRLVAAQDAERRRIERNIHDGAQQQLVPLAIKLSITESMIGTDTEGEREMLAELRRDAAGAVRDLRDLARGIYPPLLASKGLVAALEAQAAKAPVPISVAADGVGRYPQDLEAAVYFCVLEALQNAAKYAGATRADVRLAGSGHELTFEVADDGAGFDPGSRGYGTGLQGMADRLHAHGGSLDVRSAPGAGTTIVGWLPSPVLEAAG